MRRLINIILILFIAISNLSANETRKIKAKGRPTVAVVLAGGGAKGTAHLGALKVIEECGIPIDIVVGTSMGSIVGGLYSVGYKSEEILDIVQNTDWIKLILDTPDYGSQLLTVKKEQESYLLQVSLDRARVLSGTSRGGIIHGRNINALMNHLTDGLLENADFYDFPIAFACVATDANTGKKYVFHEGNLVTAMRSSMAIPTVFTPIKYQDMTLVDGGIVDNYPVDVARDMGADIVIGVDLVSELSDDELANSALDVLMKLLDLISKNRYEKNIKNTDIYINVNTTGYSAASFTSTAIDTLILRGQDAARNKVKDLLNLSKRLNVGIDAKPYSHERIASIKYKTNKEDLRNLEYNNHVITDDEKLRTAFQTGTLSLGARFDSQNYASIQLGMDIRLLRRYGVDLNLYGRLGARMVGGISIAHPFSNGGKIVGGYTIEHRDMTYYYKGLRYIGFSNYHHLFDINYNQEWKKVAYSFGLQYEVDRYRNVLAHSSIEGALKHIPTERYFDYYVKAEYNSLNAMYFPSNGSQVEVKGEVVTDNLYKFDGTKPLPIISAFWRTSAPINSRLNIIPHISARVIASKNSNVPMSLNNYFGGLHRSMWVEQQIEIAGITNMEISSHKNIFMGGIDIQQRLANNHFIIATIDGASDFINLDDAFVSETSFWGINLGYHYRGVAGPISLIGYWSSRTKEFLTTLNIGYYF